MAMIKTTLTRAEFEKLTWMNLSNFTEDPKEIDVDLLNPTQVRISIFDLEIAVLPLTDFREILSGAAG
jgi:hypothetical protein